MRSSSLLVACAAVVLAAGLTACGGSDSQADEATSPSASAADSPSSEAPPETAESATDLFERVAAAAAAAATVRTSFTTSSATGDVSGGGVVRFGSDYAADMTIAVPGGLGGEFRAVIVDETFYMQLGSEIGLPAGKSWISLTAEEDNPFASSLAPVIESLAAAGDVEQSFAVLKAGTALREDGREDVEGVSSTKYVVTVDIAKAVEGLEAAGSSSFQALQDLGVTTFDYSIWVDDDDLPRKYSQTFDVGGATTTSTATYSDWGNDVSVAAPPVEQVASFDELTG